MLRYLRVLPALVLAFAMTGQAAQAQWSYGGWGWGGWGGGQTSRGRLPQRHG